MAEFTIKQVKLLKDDKIRIDYFKHTGDSLCDMSGKFTEFARPDFYDAIKGLSKSLIKALELNSYKDISKRIKPIGVEIKYTNDGMIAVIIGNLKLNNTGLLAEIKTPRLSNTHKKNTILMTDDIQDAISLVEFRTQDYLSGKRAQGNLFDKDDDDDKQAAKQPPVGATVMDPAAAAKAVEAVSDNVVPMAR